MEIRDKKDSQWTIIKAPNTPTHTRYDIHVYATLTTYLADKPGSFVKSSVSDSMFYNCLHSKLQLFLNNSWLASNE